MARKEHRPIHALLTEARRTLGMSQKRFGYAVGSSHRTAARWDAGASLPAEHHLRKLAELLHPHNRALAAEVADFIDETLESLGIEAPAVASASVTQAPPTPRPEDLIDVVVLAAMEATGSSSSEVRQLLQVVFKRAREVGLAVDVAEKALSAANERAARPAAASPGRAKWGARADVSRIET